MNLIDILKQEAKRRGFPDQEFEDAIVQEVKKTMLVVDCNILTDEISRQAIKSLCLGQWSLVVARERILDISVPSESCYDAPILADFVEVTFRKEESRE